MDGLGFLNIELTDRCSKVCGMCGRRKWDREHPNKVDYGDMPYEMVEEIARQVPKGVTIQYHWNGDPLLYPRLGDALSLYHGHIRSFNTNAKALLEKADEVIGNLETLVISVIESDPEGDIQYETVRKFLDIKSCRKPSMVYRLLGKVDRPERWYSLPGIIARRILHDPEGSRNYTRAVTVPEIGICLDLLTHLAINRFGEVSVCVRFDPEKHGVIGDLKYHTLSEIWNGPLRKHYIQTHLEGNRGFLHLCGACHYFGIPRGD